MQSIANAQPKVIKLWGLQTPKCCDYRLLKYILKVEIDDKVLLHNVITGELVILSEEESKIVNALPSQYTEEMAELVKNHFLIPVDFNEEKSVTDLRRIMRRLFAPKSVDHFVILPTTYCNARCFYCYESDFEHIHMSEETALKVVDFIVRESKGNKIGLSWFGGEPTLGADRIDLICKELTDKGIKFNSSMVSNGYLLDEEMISRAKSGWHLNMVQITLDGREEVYNRTKNYQVADPNPYKRVLSNISSLLAHDIKVSIRMNLGYHNFEELRLLVEELAEQFSGEQKIHVYSECLFEDAGSQPVRYEETQYERLEEYKYELKTIIERHKLSGFGQKGLPFMIDHACMSDSSNSLVIHPDGALVICEHYSSKDRLGTIEDGLFDRKVLDEWTQTKKYARCDTCPIFPSCIVLDKCPDMVECSEVRKKRRIEECEQAVRDKYINYKNSFKEE